MNEKQLGFGFDEFEQDDVPTTRSTSIDDGKNFRNRIRSQQQLGLFGSGTKCKYCEKVEVFDRPAEVGWFRYKITGSKRREKGIVCSADCFIAAMGRQRTIAETDTRTRVPFSLTDDYELNRIF